MEVYLYAKVKKNWNYIHPVNKFITAVDYLIEKIASKMRKPIFIRQFKFKLKKGLHI